MPNEVKSISPSLPFIHRFVAPFPLPMGEVVGVWVLTDFSADFSREEERGASSPAALAEDGCCGELLKVEAATLLQCDRDDELRRHVDAPTGGLAHPARGGSSPRGDSGRPLDEA